MRNQSARLESATLALTLVTCGLLFASTFTSVPPLATILAVVGVALVTAILVGRVLHGGQQS